MIPSCSPSWAKGAADEIKYTFSHSMSEGLVVGPQGQLFVEAVEGQGCIIQPTKQR